MATVRSFNPRSRLEETVAIKGWAYRLRKVSQNEEFGIHWICEVKARDDAWSYHHNLYTGHAATWDIDPPTFASDDYLQMAAVCDVLRKIMEDEFPKEYVPGNRGASIPIGDAVGLLDKYRRVRFWLRRDNVGADGEPEFRRVGRQRGITLKTVKVDFRGITVEHTGTTYEEAKQRCACDMLYRLVLRAPWTPGNQIHIRGCLCQDCADPPSPRVDC